MHVSARLSPPFFPKSWRKCKSELIMVKLPSQLPEQLLQVTKAARPLREWARHTMQEPANKLLSQTLRTFSKREFDARRDRLEKAHRTLARQHEQLDAFFKSVHLPLPPQHPMARDWGRVLSRLRSAAARKRRKAINRSSTKETSSRSNNPSSPAQK